MDDDRIDSEREERIEEEDIIDEEEAEEAVSALDSDGVASAPAVSRKVRRRSRRTRP